MTPRFLARALVAACLLVLPSTAAAAAPDPGDWTGPVLSFTAGGDGLLVSPELRVEARRCRALSVTLRDDLRVRGGRFSARVVRGGVRLRIKGRFVSATKATGTVRGKLKPRARGRAACRFRKLDWTTSLTVPAAADEPTESADEEWEDESWEDEEEYAEDEEWEDGDEDVAPDDEDFWEEETDEEIAAEGDPFE